MKIDGFHNVTGFRHSKNENAKTVLIRTHLDRIGLMASKIDENGFVAFTNLGCVDERILPGTWIILTLKGGRAVSHQSI